MDKHAELNKLREQWKDCKKCGLCKERNYIVFGEGNPDAHILIIGEAPGEIEDRVGKPFVGEAGRVLDRFLHITKLNRTKDLYITNLVGCRPTMTVVDEKTKEKVRENRTPSKEERLACKERLNRIIYIVDPLMIVALGKTALQSLTGANTVITKSRGDIRTRHMTGVHTEIRYPVLPVYHPAYLSRIYDFQASGPWGQTARDFELLCKIVDYLRLKYYATPTPDRGDPNDIEEGEED